MGGVGTSILGRPRPLLGHRRADHGYTLNCDEPDNVAPHHYAPLTAYLLDAAGLLHDSSQRLPQ